MNSRFWSPVVHRLTPYVPGEQPKLTHRVKLNTNENPYGPSPRVLAAIQAELSDALRLYPDPNAERLKQAIAVVIDDFHGDLTGLRAIKRAAPSAPAELI